MATKKKGLLSNVFGGNKRDENKGSETPPDKDEKDNKLLSLDEKESKVGGDSKLTGLARIRARIAKAKEESSKQKFI